MAGPRIVLIEDEDAIRGALRRYLEREGYEVADAPEGGAGLVLLREKPAALVITDIFMEGREGLETIREIRREFPETRIIAMSGGSDALDPLAFAEALGASRVLAKPFDLAELGKAVAEVLNL
jgi:two-component system chemotaxis response regulator CheY